MFNSKDSRRRHRLEAGSAHVRRPKWRRLAIEQMENRLMLSGTDLDTTTFNLDFLSADYAIVSTSGAILRFDPAADFANRDLNGSLHFNSASTGSSNGLSASEFRATGEGVAITVMETGFEFQQPVLSDHPRIDHHLFDAPGFQGTAKTGLVGAPGNTNIGTTGLAHSDATFDPVNANENSAPRTETSRDIAGPAEKDLPASAIAVSQPDILLNSPTAADETLVVDAADAPAEGGMIPIQQVVGELASETIVASAGRPRAPNSVPAEIRGELARVAVMELIRGEADPAVPRPTADHTYVIAVNDKTTSLTFAATHRQVQTDANWAVEVIAEQAELVASLMTPARPIDLAATVSLVSNAFGTATISPRSETPAVAVHEGDELATVRNVAFSQWGDQRHETGAAARGGSYGWVDAVPLLTILACERVVASKNQRQRQPVEKPAKAKRSFTLRRIE
jgi:hypothetical protein